ncbi:MAG: xanthine dehydrogenase accessory protein XdhC [Pseudomonadota bacterium]
MTITYPSFERILGWFASGKPVILVTVEKTKGSAPREKGTVMGVTEDAISGTIGGGQLEWLAMEHARKMLTEDIEHSERKIPLGPEIGQCCGGQVVLNFQRANANLMTEIEAIAAREQRDLPAVYIFGAGHTGTALAGLMVHMPVNSMLIDTRADAIAELEEKIPAKQVALPEEIVREARPGSAYVTMTHEHSLDFLITAEALSRGDASYCGMIGSATKRAVFCNWLEENGYQRSLADKLVCPIGGNQIKDKRPEIIAALTMAEILAALHTAAIGEIK